MRVRRLALLLLPLLWLRGPAAAAGEEAFPSLRDQQVALARHFEVYDFEPRPGRLNSRDTDFDNFPDFWRRVRLPSHPAYETIEIVTDPWRQGADPTQPFGHVLHLTYSGEPVAVETVIPREVDPQLAYEVTAFARTRGLDHSLVRIEITWLQIDEEGQEEQLGRPDAIHVPPGQRDWTEAPLLLRINDIHPRATHVRLACRIEDNPRFPGADRHGEAWFDDIRIVSRPKIAISAEELFRDDNEPLQIVISYQGLIPNVPDPAGGEPVGKAYSRRIEVKDVHGEPIRLTGEEASRKGRKRLAPDNASIFTEEIGLEDRLVPEDRTSPRRRGVFYLHVTLYGARQRPLAAVTRVVGRWAPPPAKPSLKHAPGALDHFAVRLDPVRFVGEVKENAIYETLRHLGLYRGLVEVWGNTPDGTLSDERLPGTVNLLRRLRSAGMRFTGNFGRTPAVLVPQEPLVIAMRERLPELRRTIQQPAMELGPQMEDWLWGAPDEPGFDRPYAGEVLLQAREALQEYASAFSQGVPLTLGRAERLPELRAAQAVSFFVPAEMDETRMLWELARVTPTRFAGLLKWEAERFPSAQLAAFARNAQALLETKDVHRRLHIDEAGERGCWLYVEPRGIDAHERQAPVERAQAVELARKLVLGRVLGCDRIHVGPLTDPERGLAAISRDGRVVPRPALLAARTLAEHLSGAEYLGSFQIAGNVANYVFRSREDPGGAVMAAWYDGRPTESAKVDIGVGWGPLHLVDMAGNRRSVRSTFTLGPMPVLLEGLGVPAARTRMSIRIMDDPPLLSMTETQEQRLQIRNFHSEPLVGTIRLVYAANLAGDGQGRQRLRLEPGWAPVPALRLSLPAGGEGPENRVEIRQTYRVRPTRNAVLGEKFVRLEVHLAAATEMRFNLMRSTTLTSDLEMRIRSISAPERPNERVLRLMLRWRPDPTRPHPARLLIRPYYQVAGDRQVFQGTMVVYPATDGEEWGGAAIRDLRLPRRLANVRVYVGADEDGGPRFLRREVTHLFREDQE